MRRARASSSTSAAIAATRGRSATTCALSGWSPTGRRLTADGNPLVCRWVSHPAHRRSQPTSSSRRSQIRSRSSSSASSSPSGSSGAGQPAARNPPSAASSSSMSAVAVTWCTRAGKSPAALVSVRIEIPSARAEASAQLRSRSACSRRHADRDTRSSTHRCRCHAAIRSVIVTHEACPASDVQQSGHAGAAGGSFLIDTPIWTAATAPPATRPPLGSDLCARTDSGSCTNPRHRPMYALRVVNRTILDMIISVRRIRRRTARRPS